MLGRIDHVGYVARDVTDAATRLADAFGLQFGRRFHRPEFSLSGVYLESRAGSIEVFTFTDSELRAQRLHDADLRLDHVAFEVDDIDREAAHLRRVGVRFCSPDARLELAEPVLLSGVRHLWTVPATSWGQSIQILERVSE